MSQQWLHVLAGGICALLKLATSSTSVTTCPVRRRRVQAAWGYIRDKVIVIVHEP